MEAEGSEMKEVRRREGERDESLGAERELLPPTLLVSLRRESEATGSRDKAISLSTCSLALFWTWLLILRRKKSLVKIREEGGGVWVAPGGRSW